jgi:hypothetical protein
MGRTKLNIHQVPTALQNTSGTNTGDETTSTIKTKLGITTLSGSNTGDQDLSGLMVKSSNLSDVSSNQTALNNITAVSGATNEYVLTKDTSTGNAIFKVASGGAVSWNNVSPTASISKVFADSPYSIPTGTFVLIDSTNGAVSVVLPATGKVRIKWIAGTNTVTLSVTGAGTIDNSATYTIVTLKDCIEAEATSTGVWYII